MAACALVAVVWAIVGGSMNRQERRCTTNVCEIGSRIFRLEAHVGIGSQGGFLGGEKIP